MTPQATASSMVAKWFTEVRYKEAPNEMAKDIADAIAVAVAYRDQEWTHALHHAQENTPGGGEFRSSPTGPDIALCEKMFIGHEAAAIQAERNLTTDHLHAAADLSQDEHTANVLHAHADIIASGVLNRARTAQDEGEEIKS